jgi:D-lyxose ketol-isomerase
MEAPDMEIIRNADGTLVVPVKQVRTHGTEDGDDNPPTIAESATQTEAAPGTRLLHPGEGGYDEALAAWDSQQNPERAPVVSTASGRQEAMTLVHEVATSPDHSVTLAMEALDDPKASGEALRHVLIGGVHSVEDFASEVAEAEGGEPMSAHETTKIIGEILAELD